MIDAKITELKLPYPNLEDRLIRVYVPAHEDGETFPVIYMTDGQNLFEEETSTFGSWLTREAVEAERKSSGQGAIIVGIHNDGAPWQRANELCPRSIGEIVVPDEIPKEARSMIAQEGEVFAEFVLSTVKPVIEDRFPVKTGRENTAFCGSSSGGLESFYMALNYPEVFCAAGVFSPVYYIYSPADLQSWILSSIKEKMPYLYFYAGGGDELEKVLREGMEFVYDFLVQCYPSEQLNAVILPENKHNEEAWREIFKDFLHTFCLKRFDYI
ncbi:MAG: alpha/beta hydrolase [Ruminococcus sp.]|nr:alpha/beta hydrolase [Ruminococcus sp.]